MIKANALIMDMTMERFHPKIVPFMEYLQSLRARPALEEILNNMQSFDISTEDLGEFVQFHTGEYRRNLMFENEHLQLLCICWKEGQSSPIHDHSASICAVKIISGIASETMYEVTADQSIKPIATVDYPAGVIGSADSDVHHIANLQDDDQDLVTLHCYAPPLEKGKIFTEESGF
jgi:cysteine dioxygenase